MYTCQSQPAALYVTVISPLQNLTLAGAAVTPGLGMPVELQDGGPPCGYQAAPQNLMAWFNYCFLSGHLGTFVYMCILAVSRSSCEHVLKPYLQTLQQSRLNNNVCTDNN